ncbi:hypothetical protein [Moraxella oblonga]|uniref:hypothetical protein n=1 Tax=Moraxella oblonga TaxID=200413 RepID=UPI00082B5D8B|nr:hypothetical protein [Moraxella oblonga]
MNFIGYLLLGSAMYLLGFMINLKILHPKRKTGAVYTLMHPTILGFVGVCFAVMLLVSFLMGRFLLNHDPIDVAFVLVNSAVATGVFYFGLNPDQTKMNMPD